MMEWLVDAKVPLWQVVGVVSVIALAQHIFAVKQKKKQQSAAAKSASSGCPFSSGGVSAAQAPHPIPGDTKKSEENVKDTEVVKEAKKETVKEAKKDTADNDIEEDDDEEDGPYDPDWLFYDGPYSIKDDYNLLSAPMKMIMCVNMELKMGKGKIAAQCGHAVLGAYKIARKHCKSGLNVWERTGVAKVVVKVEQEKEMYELFAKAKEAGLVAYIVQDAGRTQIAAGSHTVLIIGPASARRIDPICQHLKLL